MLGNLINEKISSFPIHFFDNFESEFFILIAIIPSLFVSSRPFCRGEDICLNLGSPEASVRTGYEN